MATNLRHSRGLGAGTRGPVVYPELEPGGRDTVDSSEIEAQYSTPDALVRLHYYHYCTP